MKYEQAMKELEEIVAKLEEGSVPLDESLKLYEKASGLAKFCNECLDNAEQKIISLEQAEDVNE